MIKFFVKKPFFVVVSVIIILIIGGVSLGRMNTDLMPDMEIPYLMVITTEPGASPVKVENDVSRPLESLLGTVNGVENIVSQSADNYSMIMLEFSDHTNMDSALVRVSKVVDSAELPEECGTPNIMEISMDMMATMYVGVDYKGKDIKQLTDFTKKTLQPFLERQEGVASISSLGLTTDSIEIRLDKEKIDTINNKILEHMNRKLSDARKEIEKAENQLEDGKKQLAEQKEQLQKQQGSTNKELADAQVKMNQAQAMKAAYEAALTSQKAGKMALEAEKKAYTDAKIEDTYKKINQMLSGMNSQLGKLAEQSGVTIPSDIEQAVENETEFQQFLKWMQQFGNNEQTEDLSYESLKQIYDVVKVRIPQIDTELANLSIEIKGTQAIYDSLNENMKDMDKNQSDVISGGYTATSGFGAGQAQMSAGETQIENSKKELEEAKNQLEQSKKAALENANIDALLSLDTLSTMITAQNLSMPAGYIDDDKDNQWLVEVGDNYDDVKQLKNMVLTKVKGIGKIKLSDVAKITVVDNAGDSYSKINGRDAILLAVYKSSTANTSEVAKNVSESFRDIEEDNPGLSITSLMDQSSYIDIIIRTVLKSMLLGALLALIVLALFLKDVKPTIIVAFSIPFSVLFAIIIMYFTNITLNVMSMAGLCLGIGMLVDNSIVVMENIYRLRNMNIPAPRAAVQGARQVAAPIIASTLTTICVFLPMVYVTGMISDLLIPFAFTMTYALVASLIVALTVVPTMGANILKNTKEHKQKWFDTLKDYYGNLLEKCLRHKIIPLAIAVILLILCIVQVFRMGLVMMDDMESNQISVSLTMPEDTEKEASYAAADKVMQEIMKIDGIDTVGAMDGNAGATASATGGTDDNYTRFTFQIITDEKIRTTKQFRKIRKQIEENTKNISCEELTVASSAFGGMSNMLDQGLEVKIYGPDQQKLIAISNDIVKMMQQIKGCENPENGLDEKNKQIHLKINKNKAAACGLTTAQIYQQLAAKITTDKTAITIQMNHLDLDVNVINDTEKPDYDSLMKTEITASTMDEEGKEVKKTYKLSEFAQMEVEDSMETVLRENQTRYLSVTAKVHENYNAALLSRKLEKKINSYQIPDGYTVEIQGESEEVMEMIVQMLMALALGFLLVYLVMVAQFQSLLSPFIIIFTVPLAFTGGMLGLMLFGQSISAMAMMGFMILMGTVVNNGIVFVDYANKLRLQGVEKRTALIATGKTRMRPILMTALTTILSMSVMVFSQDAGNAMQKGMAIVVSFGLLYATLMTLFIVPVLYDILYRRQPKIIDVGDDLDEIPDETAELLKELEDEKVQQKENKK